MSDLIQSAAIASVSVTIAPQDSRCRYWAKVIRADQPLPAPSAVSCANDVPGAYARRGDEELFVGDVLIEGEENSRRKARGWTYWVTFVDADGKKHTVIPRSGHKAAMKAAGLAPTFLTGSGDVSACVRIAIGVRSGLAAAILAAEV